MGLKKFLLTGVLFASLLSSQVFAGTTTTQNVGISATAVNALTLWVENSTSSGLVNALTFGNVDGVGKNPASGSADAVRIINTSGVMTDPLTAFGSGYTNGAYYIVGSGVATPALNLRVRITGGYDANVSVKQSAATMSIGYAASNATWSNTSQVTNITATDSMLSQTPIGSALSTARANDETVSLDLGIKVMPLDFGALASTLVFTADSNGF
ncbi:MAG: hypothetical protein AABZ74_08170 [Cyanobacteriota bacterium]|mgnify:CR=1 FL=1